MNAEMPHEQASQRGLHLIFSAKHLAAQQQAIHAFHKSNRVCQLCAISQ